MFSRILEHLGVAPFIAALLAFSIILTVPPAPRLTLGIDGSDAVLKATGIRGALTVLGIKRVPEINHAYFYYDAAYLQGRGMNPVFSMGFITHFKGDLRRAGLHTTAQIIDAAGLKYMMREDPRGRCLLVLGGVLPETIRTEYVNMLMKWISRGGLLVWAGEPFDALFSRIQKGDQPGPIVGPDYNRWESLYEPLGPMSPASDLYSQPQTAGLRPSKWWAIAKLSFVWTTFKVRADELTRIHGTPIGYIDERGNSSVSVIPLESGRLVFFADGFNDERAAAEQIAQVLLTGVWYNPRTIETRSMSVDENAASRRIDIRSAAMYVAYANDVGFLPAARVTRNERAVHRQ